MAALKRRRSWGFGMLDIMLATGLLAGLILLIATTLGGNQKIDNARSLGRQLHVAVDALIQQKPTADESGGKFACSDGSGIVTTLSSNYLGALSNQGVDLCDATVTITQCDPGAGDDPCLPSST